MVFYLTNKSMFALKMLITLPVPNSKSKNFRSNFMQRKIDLQNETICSNQHIKLI